MLAVGLEDGTVILSVGGVLKTGKLSMAGPVDAISFSHDLSSLFILEGRNSSVVRFPSNLCTPFTPPSFFSSQCNQPSETFALLSRMTSGGTESARL